MLIWYFIKVCMMFIEVYLFFFKCVEFFFVRKEKKCSNSIKYVLYECKYFFSVFF